MKRDFENLRNVPQLPVGLIEPPQKVDPALLARCRSIPRLSLTAGH